MYVEVTDGVASVHAVDDCAALDVRVAAGRRGDLDAALRAAGLGSWDGSGEADLDVAGLRTLARATATAPDWDARWDAMIGYAARKGWLSPDGHTVRAHVDEL